MTFVPILPRRRIWAAVSAALLLAACNPSEPPAGQDPNPNAAGLVTLPCLKSAALHAANHSYCWANRHFVTPDARQSLVDAAKAMAAKYPGVAVQFMEASWPSGKRPMPPHLSHGDGREVDLALFYETKTGKPQAKLPTSGGYNAFEPPLAEKDRVCGPKDKQHNQPDPAKSRNWRLDETRTRDLIALLAADKRVRRIFIEPHLKARLGFGAEPKVRFAGCQAARHDDHLHIDFF